MNSFPQFLLQMFQSPASRGRRRQFPQPVAEACEVRIMMSAVAAAPAINHGAITSPSSDAILTSTGQSLVSITVLNSTSGTVPINFNGPFGGSITGNITKNGNTVSLNLIYTTPNGQKWTEVGIATLNGSTINETLTVTSPSGQKVVETGTFTVTTTATSKNLTGNLIASGPNGKNVVATVSATKTDTSYNETVNVTGPNGGKFTEIAKIAQINGKTNVDLTVNGPNGGTFHANFNLPPKKS